MACIIKRPAPQVLFDRYKDMFSVTVLGGSPIIPESNEWYVTSLNYAISEEFYSVSEQQWKERDPRFACCDNLVSIAATDGVFPKGATFAQGYFEVTGSAGAVLPALAEFSFGDKQYRIVSTVPLTIPVISSSYPRLVVRAQAIEPGSESNNPVSNGTTTGTLSTNIVGINQTVTVFGGSFCNGAEAETCEQFRQRYLARKRYSPVATDAWLRQKLLEWPCLTRICARGGNCCETAGSGNCQDCRNKIEYYVFFDNTFPCGLSPQCVVDEITDWIFGNPQGYGLGQAPIGICGKIYTANATIINIKISGSDCFTPSQKLEISNRITALFKTFCPSGYLSVRQFESVILQVVGSNNDFEVVMEATQEGAIALSCGDIEISCDYMPCLGNVIYTGDDSTVGGCVT